MVPVEQTVQMLERVEPQGPPILSIYVLTDPSTAPGRNLHAQLADLERSLSANVDGGESHREALNREMEAVRRFLDSLDTPPRSLAVFSSSGRGLFHAVPLTVRVTPQAYWDSTPYLRPLRAALDEFERVLVALVDKERARLFRVFVDQIEEVESFEDLVPGKHKQGGWSQARYQRHHEAHVYWHVQRAAEAIARLADQERVDRILVSATPEVMAELRHLMPKPLRSRMMEFRVPMRATPAEVLASVQEVERDLERDEERELLRHLEEHRGRGTAAFGPREVLEAVVQQRAYVLVVDPRVAVEGGRCERCGLLSPSPGPTACSACGGPVRAVSDLVEVLAEHVESQGGRVEEVRGPAANRLEELGGIAALLRYPVAAPAS